MTIQQTIFLCVRYKLPNTKRHTKYSKSSSVSKPSNVQKRSKLPAREYLPSVRQFFYSKFLYPVSNFHKKSNCQLQARRRVRSATVPGSWAPESPLPHRRAFIPWRNDYSDRLQRYAFTPPYFRSNRLWSGNYSSAACAVSGKLWCKWRRRGWEGGGGGVSRHGGSVISNKSGGFIGRWCIKCFARCCYGLEYAGRRRLLSSADGRLINRCLVPGIFCNRRMVTG